MVTFPSIEFFTRLAAAMDAAPERYRKLGPVDLTLVPRITMGLAAVPLAVISNVP